MIHTVDEAGEAENVGEEDELLPDVGADLACRCEELDGEPAAGEAMNSSVQQSIRLYIATSRRDLGAEQRTSTLRSSGSLRG